MMLGVLEKLVEENKQNLPIVLPEIAEEIRRSSQVALPNLIGDYHAP